MLRLLCSLRASYDTLDDREEPDDAPRQQQSMDGGPGPDGEGDGGLEGGDLKLSRVARSPDPTPTGVNTKDSPLPSWKAVLGIKAKSNTRHLDRSVRTQQASASSQEADRYIRLPERSGRARGDAFEQTHVYLTHSPRAGEQSPHKDLLRLPGPRAARGEHLEKSSSENALQRLGVRPVGGASTSGPSKSEREASGALQRLLRLEQRSPRPSKSRSKPRASSLERNHKFRVLPGPAVLPSPSPSRARSPDSVLCRLSPASCSEGASPLSCGASPCLPPAPPPPTAAAGSAQQRLRFSSGAPQHELTAGLVNLVMSKDKGSAVQGNFINKPARGWLHADGQVADEGICYAVRYIGCLEVKESMKALNFDTRSLIAKECIARVCEAAGLKSVDRKPRLDKKMTRSLGEQPIMDQAGSNVSLTITSSRLTLTTLEEGQVIASHEMPNISFASGGDPDTMDFVAYVAKDHRYGRVCFVLECGGVAQNVITTIGQAFELRFKEYLKRAPPYTKSCMELPAPALPATEDPEYYNDLPGKVPPDVPAEAGRRRGGRPAPRVVCRPCPACPVSLPSATAT